jgi:membrane protein YqaA with SNARE-associated domain
MEWFDAVLRFILSFGLPGLFALAALDSTVFFFMPFAFDWFFVVSVSHHREWFLYYALIAAAGSMVGCAVMYKMFGETSEQILEKRIASKKLDRVKKKLEKRSFIPILFASLMPPPFPFSPFIVVASILKISFKKLVAAVFTGRLIRFLLEAILALIFGRQILKIFHSTVCKVVMLALFVIILVGSAVSMYRWTRKAQPA